MADSTNPYLAIVGGENDGLAPAVDAPAPTVSPDDALAPLVPQDEPANPYAEIVDAVANVNDAENEQLTALFKASRSGNLDKDMAVWKMAEASGLDPMFVAANYDTFTAAAEVENWDVEKFKQNHKAEADLMLRRPELAGAIMGDEQIQNLPTEIQKEQRGTIGKYVEASLDFMAEAGTHMFSPKEAKPFAIRPDKDVAMVRAPKEGMLKSEWDYQREGLGIAKLNTKIMLKKIVGADVNDLETERVSREQKLGPQKFYGDLDPVDQFELDAIRGFASQPESMGLQAAGMAVSLATKQPLVNKIAQGLGIAGSAIQTFELEAGGAFGDFRKVAGPDGSPVDEDVAILGSVAYGLLSTAVEMGANQTILRGAFGNLSQMARNGERKAFVKSLMSDGRMVSMLKAAATDWKGGIGAEMGEEFTQDGLQQSIQFLVGRMAGKTEAPDIAGGLGHATEAGIVAAPSIVAMGPAMMTLNVVSQKIGRTRMMEADAQLKAVLAAGKGKLAQADPEAFAEVIAAQTEETTGQKLTSVYVDPEALLRLYQGTNESLETAATDLMGEEGPKRLAKAVSTGQLLEVPVAEYVSKWATKPIGEALVAGGEITSHPSMLTPAQQQRMDKEIEETANALVERYNQETMPKAESDAEQAFQDALAGQIAKARTKTTPDQAKQQALILAKGVATLIAKGVKADDAYQLFATNINKAPPTREFNPVAIAKIVETFEQAGPEGQASAVFTDYDTGLYNKEGLAALPVPSDRRFLARFQRESVKLRNDQHGHNAIEGDLRRMATVLRDSGIEDAARDGTELVAWVKDEKEAHRLSTEMRKQDERLHVTYDGLEHIDGQNVADTIEKARLSHQKTRDELVAKGVTSHRKGVPTRYQGDVKVAWNADKELKDWTAEDIAASGFHPKSAEAKALHEAAGKDLADFSAKGKATAKHANALRPEHRAAYAKMDKSEVFDRLYRYGDEDGGLLTGEGAQEAQRLLNFPFQASADLRGLGDVDRIMGHGSADAFVRLFNQAIALAGGTEFNAAKTHRKGDEYWAHGKSDKELNRFFKAVEEHTSKIVVYSKSEDGASIHLQVGVAFAHGVAGTFDDAEVNLKLNKEAQVNVPRIETLNLADGRRRIRQLVGEGFESIDLRSAVRGGSAGKRGANEGGRRGGREGSSGARVVVAAPARISVVTPQGTESAHYEVREAASLVASHDANSFQPRADYPANVQEREYHKDKAEQAKVASNAASLNPALVLSDEQTATGGPPLVTAGDRAIVLGGNGRTMIMQRAFANEVPREAYRSALMNKAATFGLDTTAISSMKAPVLVRVMDDIDATSSTAVLQQAVRRYNVVSTQALSPLAAAVASARTLTDATVATIGEALAGIDGTLRDLMAKKPQVIIKALRADNVITDTNTAEWTSPNGSELTDAAKDRIEAMFLGRVLASSARIENSSKETLAKVERAIASVLRVAAVNPALDETRTLRQALDVLADAKRRGLTLEDYFAQLSLFQPAMDDGGMKTVDTPEFKSWFGKSKVVDSNGSPLVVYHGTDASFDTFSEEKLGSNTSAKSAKGGFFFTDSARAAGLYPAYAQDTLLRWGGFIVNKDRSKAAWEKVESLDSQKLQRQLRSEIEKSIEERDSLPSEKRNEYQDRVLRPLLDEENALKNEVRSSPEYAAWRTANAEEQRSAEEDNILARGQRAEEELNRRLGKYGGKQILGKPRDDLYEEAMAVSSALRRAIPLVGEKIDPTEKAPDLSESAIKLFEELLPLRRQIAEAGDYAYSHSWSERFAAGADSEGEVWEATKGDPSPQIFPVYLSMQNPLIHEQQTTYRDVTFAELVDRAKAAGNDGLIIKNTHDPLPMSVYVVFKSSQIKSSIANKGSFDPSRSEIYEQGSASDEPESGSIRAPRDESYRQSPVAPDLASTSSDATRSMAALLDGNSQKAVGEAFKAWAKYAAVDPKQVDMFGVAPSEDGARRVLFANARKMPKAPSGVEDARTTKYEQPVHVNLGARRDAVEQAAEATKTFFQPAYHGTPHRGIEKSGFKLESIGTGEGAQVYGWGLYFAENKEIGEWYRKKLAGAGDDFSLKVNGQPRGYLDDGLHWSSSDGDALWMIQEAGRERVRKGQSTGIEDVIDSAIDQAEADLAKPGVSAEKKMLLEAALHSLEDIDQRFNLEIPTGQLYSVEVPENDRLLDYDKPLGEQSPGVQKGVVAALKAAGYGDTTASDWGAGQAVYDTLASLLGPQSASEALRDQGIPGMRYLDQFSAANGDGSHNFVIWDEAEIRDIQTFYEAALPIAKDGKTTGVRGWVDFVIEGGRRVHNMFLTKDADLSTFLHESGHIYLDVLNQISKRDDCPPAVKEDSATVLKWLKAVDFSAITREQHEKFARGFERYLMEGKAPSLQLKRAFKSFARWLKTLYGEFDGLNVELNDEVRAVFDRLLATDKEIAAAKKRSGASAKVFADQKSSGMTDSKWKAYLAARERLDEQAVRAGHLEELREALKKKQAEIAKRKRALAKELGDEYDRLQKTRAVALLENGQLLDADGAVIAQGFDDESLDSAAQLLGYDDAAAMEADAAGHPSREVWVEDEVKSRTKIERDNATKPDSERMRADTDAGLHGDEAEEVLFGEMAALRAKAGEQRKVDREAAKMAAKKIVDAEWIGRLSPYRALTAERTAAEKSAVAASKGNWKLAYQHKQQQVLNHYIWKATTEAIKTREQFTKTAHDLSRNKARARLNMANPAFLDSVDAMLEAVGLVEERQQDQPRQPVTSGLQGLADVGVSVHLIDADAILREVDQPRDWRQMTVGEVTNYLGALKMFKQATSDALTTLVDGKRLEKSEVIAHLMNEAMTNLPKQPAPESSVGATGMLTGMLSTAHQLDGDILKPVLVVLKFLGGDKLDSMWNRAVHHLLQKAKQDEADLLKKAVEPIYNAMRAMPKGALTHFNDDVKGAELFPGHRTDLKPPSKRWEILAMALNWGSDGPNGNRHRLTEGRTISRDEVTNALKMLTSKEWDWVESIWDACESLWPLARDLEERTSGLAPDKIAAAPFSMTVDGKERVIKGGYFPAVYDRRANSKVGEIQASNSIASLLPGASLYTRPGTPHNHLKKRSEDFADCIALDLTTVLAHLSQVAHDVTHREAIKSIGGLLADKNIQGIIKERLGQEWAQLLWNWVRDVGNARGADVATYASAQGVGRVLRTWRSNVATAILGYGIDIAIGDLSNFAFSVTGTPLKAKYLMRGMAEMVGSQLKGIGKAVSTGHLAAGLSEFAKSPNAMREWCLSKSGELRFRQEGVVREYRAMLDRTTARNPMRRGLPAWWRDNAFIFMEASDAATATPVWLGAYRQGLAKGMEDAKAVEFADTIIQSRFPSHAKVDQAAILRGGATAQMILFGGFWSVAHSAYRGAVHPVYLAIRGDKAAGHRVTSIAAASAGAMLDVLAISMAVSVMGDFLTGRGPEPEDGDDDAERYLRWFSRKLLLGPLNALPFAGPLVDVASGHKPSVRSAPTLAVLDTMAKSIAKADGENADPEKYGPEILKAAAMFAGQPAYRPIRWGVEAVKQSEAPDSPLRAISAIIYGDRGEKQSETPLTALDKIVNE